MKLEKISTASFSPTFRAISPPTSLAMADNQQSWIPYDGGRDCSQGFCSVYCPQWCYALFPPPPPFSPSVAEDDDDDSGNAFSPLVIVFLSILATSLVVFSYCTIVSKYRASVSFRRRNFRTRRTVDGEDGGGDHQWQRHEGWQVSPTTGLDEAQISKITVCRYKRGEGLVEGTDCSVCLGEFREEDHLRLLPKCSHAFHLQCIDTWLKSHSNCPLCRANIVSATPAMAELESAAAASLASEQEREMVVIIENVGRNGEEEDLKEEEEDGNVVVEEDEDIRPVRRSFSMSPSHQERASIAEVLHMGMEDEFMKKQGNAGENCKGGGRSCRPHCVPGAVRMKRSLSSGRNRFSRQGTEKNSLLPV